MRNIRKRHAGNTPGGCRTFAGRTRREAGRNGDDEARKTGSVQYFRDAFPRLVSALFRTQIRRREGHRRATHGGTFGKNATSAPPFSMGRSGISAETSKVGVRMYGCLKGKVRMFPCRTSALSNPIRRVSPPPFPHFFRHFRARFSLNPMFGASIHQSRRQECRKNIARTSGKRAGRGTRHCQNYSTFPFFKKGYP